MNPIDPAKVLAKVNELNTEGNEGAPNWIAAEGLRALILMSINDGKTAFDATQGVPLKIFANTQTGEIKIFDARAFTINS